MLFFFSCCLDFGRIFERRLSLRHCRRRRRMGDLRTKISF